MKKALLPFLLTITSFTFLFAQTKPFPYAAYWKRVEKHELDQLPESAAAVVDTIYRLAKKQQNSPQLIKALLFQSKFFLIKEEDAQLKIIKNFEQEIGESSFPTRNILQSILAKQYWEYYQQNRHRIYNRSHTGEKVNPDDFRTWDLQTLFNEAHIHFQKSLENDFAAQKTDLSVFNAILETVEGSISYRPTLYDFLAHNALEFYSSREPGINRPADRFEIDSPLFFTSSQSVELETINSLSLQLHALKIFNKLILFHQQDANPGALVRIKLERLKFLKQYATLKDKDELFLEALKTLKATYAEYEVAAVVDFEIATTYYRQGNRYRAGEVEEERFKKAMAVEVCTQAIERYPNSYGARQCKSLLEVIKSKNLSITAEKFVAVGSPSRFLLSYRNIDTVSFSLYKISRKEQEDLQRLLQSRGKMSLLDSLSRLKIANAWQLALRNERDYQEHKTEALVPPLLQGIYLVVASPSTSTPAKEDLLAFTFLQVSNLALVESNTSLSRRYQVVNRVSGKAIPSAAVKVEEYGWGYGNKALFPTSQPDRNGFFNISSGRSSEHVLTRISYQGDTAHFGPYYISRREQPSSASEKKALIKPFLFTDRSIYRPGQEVYFKGILLRIKNDKSSTIADEYVEVYVEDVNRQKVFTERLQTNEFGSFSGRFTLPAGGLTGRYTIHVEDDFEEESQLYEEAYNFYEGRHTISVEEYKRPRFETEFEPLRGSFKLKDTINVKGKATAFAGNSIAGAKVVYKVHRRVRYPSWFYWRFSSHRYASPAQEITHGETTTDEQGVFTIDFAALPDESADKEGLPVFNYEVTADVTDLNGETRRATTIVKVGYHSLLATLVAPTHFNKNEPTHTIQVSSTNLNNQFEPAKGRIKVYKLDNPKQVLRERPWEAPDYQEIPKETFKILFPSDPYENEDKIAHWNKGKMVLDIYFDTEKATEIALNKLRRWDSGSYLMELETYDEWGQPVNDKHHFTLFDPDEREVADMQLFTIETDKAAYKAGEKVRLSMGSAAKELHVTVRVEKNHHIVKTEVVTLRGKKRKLSIPVTERDAEGFAIHYHFTYQNYFESGTIPIELAEEESGLEIEALSFRDKIQPGQEETWSFKVKGAKKEKMVAEMLVSMFDASLDQFKSHRWEFQPVRKARYYAYYPSNARQSIGTTNFVSVNNHHRYFRPAEMQFDQLNWFGYSFTGQSYVAAHYLQRLKIGYWVSRAHSSYDAQKQKGWIYGTVAGEDGALLPGVLVQVKDSNQRTTTGLDGSYAIRAKAGEELVISFVGFNTLSVKLEKQNILHVILVDDVKELEEVVITAMDESFGYSGDEYEEVFESAPAEDVSNRITLRGNSSISADSKTLLVVDGVVVEGQSPEPDDVLSMEVLKGKAAMALYGARAANGVIVIITKSGQKAMESQLAKVNARENFQETAFFYPHLQTDEKGNITFTFTVPEALSRWKVQLLAHDKKLASSIKTLHTLTQKELMVQPSPPRFLREGDEITFAATISNLGTEPRSGQAALLLTNALTGEPIDEKLHNNIKTQSFQVNARGTTSLSWTLQIPQGLQAVQYKIVAQAGNFSDGEQNVLPVLSNRMLVTETLPLRVRSGQSKTFTLAKLKNTNSPTLTHHQLSLEVTSNPLWYAVQALPYLMEYPYECAEQTFARYYANTLAAHILQENPQIKGVFEQWNASGNLESPLLKNGELKSLIIQETPWLQDAFSETEQKKRIALLFDMDKIENEGQASIDKLEQMQFPTGGFPWFKGNPYPNRQITLHIASGFGHLKHLQIETQGKNTSRILEKAVHFLDREILEEYRKLQQDHPAVLAAASKKGGLTTGNGAVDQKYISPFLIHYLYMRSFFPEMAPGPEVQEAIEFYSKQSAVFWKDFNLQMKGMIALTQARHGKAETARAILLSLRENSITSEELGMYWKENKGGWHWYAAPIETQSLLIEVFSEIEVPEISSSEKTEILDNLKVWLLMNKQTRQWSNTKATTEAIYALLLQGSNWLSGTDVVDIRIGGEEIAPSRMEEAQAEAGTGYFKTSWKAAEIKPEMSEVQLTKEGDGIAWGALYWQYFENLDQITPSETPLHLSKKLFLKTNTDTGERLKEITADTPLQPGDLLRVRIELKADRDMDFIHMKDMRASGLEPVNVLSQYKWQDGLGYYESTRDASTNFFFDHLPKGVYVFEYDVRVNNRGNFSNGITSIQSMYAPEFSSHSEGGRVRVQDE